MLQSQIKTASTNVELKNRYKTELSQVAGKLGGTVRRMGARSEVAGGTQGYARPRRDGHGRPNKDKQFRYWDKSEAERICSIGDPLKLRILLPVTPPQYRELKENLAERQKEHPNDQAELDVSILLSNRSDHIYRGRVTVLPDSHETNVPVGLTSKGGGPAGNENFAKPQYARAGGSNLFGSGGSYGSRFVHHTGNPRDRQDSLALAFGSLVVRSENRIGAGLGFVVMECLRSIPG